MADEIDPKLFDKRVAQRYVKKGRLDEKEWEKHVKTLPDLAEQAMPIESALDPDEFDDEEPASPPAAAATDGPREG